MIYIYMSRPTSYICKDYNAAWEIEQNVKSGGIRTALPDYHESYHHNPKKLVKLRFGNRHAQRICNAD